MRTSDAGIALIKQNEGFEPRVYDDVGRPAIGYGHDIQGDVPVTWERKGISEEEATNLLKADVGRVEVILNQLIPSDCTQNQYDALVDFAYNLGTGSLKTMLAHGWDQVPEQILRWNHIGTVVNAGLTARRQAEVEMFNS